MFHGVNKSKVKKMTQEREKKEEILQKIKVIQGKIILNKKEKKIWSKNYDIFNESRKTFLSDFSTLWNIRKTLIKQFIEQQTKKKYINFF